MNFICETEPEKRENKINDYIGYIDRTRRTTDQSRLEVHQFALTRETGYYYGLNDKDMEDLTKRFEKELELEENDSSCC